MFGNFLSKNPQSGGNVGGANGQPTNQQAQQTFNANNPNTNMTNNPVPGQQLPQGSPNANGQNDPNAQGGNQQPPKAPDPMEMFQQLMQGSSQPQQPAQDFFSIKPEQLSQLSQSFGNLGQLPPELQTKIANQDFSAVPELLAHSQRQLVQQLMPMVVNLVKAGVTHSSSQLEKSLPQKLASNNAAADIVANNPWSKPFAAILTSNFAAQNPHLSQAEITQQVNSVLSGFVENILASHGQQPQKNNMNPQSGNRQGSGGPMDWENFFN